MRFQLQGAIRLPLPPAPKTAKPMYFPHFPRLLLPTSGIPCSVPDTKRPLAPFRAGHSLRCYAVFFLFLLLRGLRAPGEGGGSAGTPSVETHCPFGGIENLYQFLTTAG
jgi:hypothetical protein